MDIFFDIETVTQHERLELAPEIVQRQWIKLSERKYPDTDCSFTYKHYAALYPEFGKIVAIATVTQKDADVFNIAKTPDDEVFYSSKFKGEDESQLLKSFFNFLKKESDKKPLSIRLIGHSIKRFDIPYVYIRSLANKVRPLDPFITYGVKPWELKHVDTVEMWKGGNMASSQCATLEMCCFVLGIPTPKTEFDGSQVNEKYWEGNNLEKIANYCLRDTIANAKLFIYLNIANRF